MPQPHLTRSPRNGLSCSLAACKAYTARPKIMRCWEGGCMGSDAMVCRPTLSHPLAALLCPSYDTFLCLPAQDLDEGGEVRRGSTSRPRTGPLLTPLGHTISKRNAVGERLGYWCVTRAVYWPARSSEDGLWFADEAGRRRGFSSIGSPLGLILPVAYFVSPQLLSLICPFGCLLLDFPLWEGKTGGFCSSVSDGDSVVSLSVLFTWA